MKNQLDSFQKMVKELSTEENPIQLVLVDWASAEQHKGNGTPLRDKLDVPVLQSPFWTHKDSIIKSWFGSDSETTPEEASDKKAPTPLTQWLDSLVLIDKDGKAIAAYPLDEGTINGKKIKPVNFKKKKSSQRVKDALSEALKKAQTPK